MKKFNNREEAFASQDYDPTKVVITGVPERHLEAAKAFINLCVGHDAVNPNFDIDYSKSNQYKYDAFHVMGSPSGVGFSFDDDGSWHAVSSVGARLASESREACNHVAELFDVDYKAMKVYKREVK